MTVSAHRTPFLPHCFQHVHRLHDNKRVVEVYDYVDSNVLMLARMYERRLRGYAGMGYRITGGLPEQQRLI